MKKGPIVCDANILIDYRIAGTAILKALGEYAEIIVPDVILDEARHLDREETESAGIGIYPVPIEMIADASNTLPGCSMEDTICYLLAKKNRWTCATNDKKLRRECLDNGVHIIRGLALLIELVEHRHLTKKQAAEAVKKIADANREITDEILTEFFRLLEEVR